MDDVAMFMKATFTDGGAPRIVLVLPLQSSTENVEASKFTVIDTHCDHTQPV